MFAAVAGCSLAFLARGCPWLFTPLRCETAAGESAAGKMCLDFFCFKFVCFCETWTRAEQACPQFKKFLKFLKFFEKKKFFEFFWNFLKFFEFFLVALGIKVCRTYIFHYVPSGGIIDFIQNKKNSDFDFNFQKWKSKIQSPNCWEPINDRLWSYVPFNPTIKPSFEPPFYMFYFFPFWALL